MRLTDVLEMKKKGEKITMVTCYDATSARILAQSSVNLILVGDSAGMVIHGHQDTLKMTTAMMCAHTESVRRGAPDAFIVGDVPLLSHRLGRKAATHVARDLLRAGANAIKVEGATGLQDTIEHLVQSGVPVMGHLGLTPQSYHALGGFRVQGKTASTQKKLLEDATNLQSWGCFALVLECVPWLLAQRITESLSVPTIGIGAGPHCDGQVLVWHDLLGLQSNLRPKFVRRYLEGSELIQDALNRFCQDVKAGDFPGPHESYEGDLA